MLSCSVAWRCITSQHTFRLVCSLPYLRDFRSTLPSAHAGMHSASSADNEVGVAIAFGSNLGDSIANIQQALKQLTNAGVKVVRQSRLYESAPAYVTDQPRFINGALAALTCLQPLELLDALKTIEGSLGRNFAGQRFGPRPLDLDIIFYGNDKLDHERLCIPHPRWQERPFVQAPLLDLFSSSESSPGPTWHGLHESLATVRQLESTKEECRKGKPEDLQCIIPLPGLPNWAWQQRTWVMGILNVTPDSFSDGGQVKGIEDAVAHACSMVQVCKDKCVVQQGADILDIGGQSTRPGATRLSTDEEVHRVVPVVRALRQNAALTQIPISIDTFDAEVARQAVQAGAHMVNDVSGGLMDPAMHATVAQLNVPYILMHMRGTPETMQQLTHYQDTCQEVGQEMQQQAEKAIHAGVQPWRIILDPGVGFAKTLKGNLELICGLEKVRSQLQGPLQGMPMLLGPSRKGFLGKLTGQTVAADRDYATAAAAALCISHGANIIRAHNVTAARDAARVADAAMLAC